MGRMTLLLLLLPFVEAATWVKNMASPKLPRDSQT
jgi:hypothetical protein